MNKDQLMIRQIDVKPSDEDMVIEGYAAVYDSPTVLWTDDDGTQYKEVIDRGAFAAADLSNVVLRYNHSPEGMVLARTTNGTLQVTPDQNGLRIRAKLAPTTAGKDLYALIKRGDVNKMSFGATARRWTMIWTTTCGTSRPCGTFLTSLPLTFLPMRRPP
ncbi:MAG: HK97 family phage prohead protease [Acidaminococcus intestini]